MEKHSKVKSQISAKTYDVGLETLEKKDDKFNSDLYKVNIFGKNVVIAPGRPINDTDIPGLVYFYVYVIKQQKVVAKLGVYEKMTKEVKEIYNLSEFPDGSLLMFDVYYNKPDLIDDFEEEEVGEELGEEELSKEELGKELEEEVQGVEEEKEGSPSLNYTASVNKKSKTMYDYLTEFINETTPILTPKQQSEKVLSMYRLLDENKKLNTEKQKMYKKLLTMLLGSKGENYMFEPNNISKLQKVMTTYNDELSVMFLFYLLENLLLIKFNLFNESNVPVMDREIRDLKLFVSVNTKEVDVKLISNTPYFMEEREIVGTSLNTVKAKVSVTKPKMESFSQVKEVDLNAESPPESVAESEGSNEGTSSNNEGSNNQGSNNEGSGISVNSAESENSKLKFKKSTIRLKSATKN